MGKQTRPTFSVVLDSKETYCQNALSSFIPSTCCCKVIYTKVIRNSIVQKVNTYIYIFEYYLLKKAEIMQYKIMYSGQNIGPSWQLPRRAPKSCHPKGLLSLRRLLPPQGVASLSEQGADITVRENGVSRHNGSSIFQHILSIQQCCDVLGFQEGNSTGPPCCREAPISWPDRCCFPVSSEGQPPTLMLNRTSQHQQLPLFINNNSYLFIISLLLQQLALFIPLPSADVSTSCSIRPAAFEWSILFDYLLQIIHTFTWG